MAFGRPAARTGAAVLTLASLTFACGGGGESAGERATPDGPTLFANNCASCHGADLRGTDQGPSMLSVVYQPSHHGDEGFRSAIRGGAPQHHWNFGPMLPIADLDDAQIDAITAFVRSEQDRLGFEPYPP